MTQLSLPLYNPRDRGKRNALQNILISISDELRRQAPIAQEIVRFAVEDFPGVLKQAGAFQLLSADAQNTKLISPFSFEIHDLVGQRTKDIYPTIDELVKHLDLPKLSAPLQDAELVGIDESKVDIPLAHSSMAFLKSIAFRMYKMPNGVPDEATGPILSELRMQFQEEGNFENENQLLGYIRNNYVAYISALTSIAYGRKPVVVLHGPLVRAIGGFSNIVFDYNTAKQLFNIDMADIGEFTIPAGSGAAVSGDASTKSNLPLVPSNAVDGETNLKKFNEFCLFSCGRRCEAVKPLRDQNAVPPQQNSVTKTMMENRKYPGFCLYFWGLRSLADLTRTSNTTVASVVENVSAATEMTRIILPSLLSQSQARQRVTSDLKTTLGALKISLPTNPQQRRDLYKATTALIVKLRLSDSNLFSYVLDEGQYTAPVQIYRYQTQNTFDAAITNSSLLGVDNSFENILKVLFPVEAIGEHPGYRVLMTYVRTTPLREPIRVEYFDFSKFSPPANLVGPVYLLSLPYQEYGLPIILYYADKLARTPTNLVRTIIEREYLELVLRNNFSDPVSIMKILGRLSRNYFQREGFQ